MKLATREVGSGRRTAALVHGASMGSDIWRDFAQILIDDYDLSIILVDLRGHGDSARASSYQVADFAADLVENLPTGLDFLIGQSLGGVSSAWAAPSLLPRRLIGLDPALSADKGTAMTMRMLAPLGPVQKRFPRFVLSALDIPPKGPPADTMERIRSIWEKWDGKMVRQLVKSGLSRPFPVEPPAVPSTLVLADKSRFVPPQMADGLRALGWDIRVKPGAGHDLHLEDPHGVITMLDDVLWEDERPA